MPRDVNIRKTGTKYTVDELISINSDIANINRALRNISTMVPGLYVVDHPQFVHDGDLINDSLLAADGLHLNFEGTRVAVSNIESAILEVKSDLVKAEFDMLLRQESSERDYSVESGIQCEDTVEDKLPFSDVVRFGEARPQPVIPKKVPPTQCVTSEPKRRREQPTQERQKARNDSNVHKQIQKRPVVPTVSGSKTTIKSKTSTQCYQRVNVRQFSNRYSVLEVEDLLSDCDDGDDIPEIPVKYVRMTGGGKVNREKDTQSPESATTDEKYPMKESITVQIISSIDEESCESESRHSLGDRVTLIEGSETDTNGQEVCENVISVEKDLKELESSFRDTNEEVSDEDNRLDKSVLDVINLLNDNENTVKPQGEPISSNKDSIINLKSKQIVEGQTFSSYDEFRNIYDEWCKTKNHPMKTDSSEKNTDNCKLFPYRKIRFSCKHAGKPRARGEGKRPLQAYLACECPVVLRLMYSSKDNHYFISKLVEDHNHTTSKGEFKHYSSNRRLNNDQLGDVKALIDLQVETKNIKTYVREKTGKVVHTKDILNIKQTVVKEKEGGLTKGQLLAAALNELGEKKQATTHIQLDEESVHVEIVYIQTMEMKEHFRKYPEILFMDTTYNINVEGYPLFTILAEDGDGRGKPVAYCYVRSETKENIGKALIKFCENNDTSGVRIVMIDKDLNEMNAIKEHIPNATLLLCKFHVMKYFKKKVSDLDIKHNEKKSLGILLQQIIDCKDQNHYDELYKELTEHHDPGFVQYYNKNWHTCQSLWVIHFRANLLTHGNNTNNKIESHNQKLKHYLSKHMHLSESVNNLAMFIDEAFTKSSYTRYSNLKTKIDHRNTDKALMQYSLLCNSKSFGIVNEEYRKFKSLDIQCVETEENFQVKYKASCHTVSKETNRCDCTIFSNFALPCRHIFSCRDKQNIDSYDEQLIPNRWRKEFEPADDDTDIHVVQTSTKITKRKTKNTNPKTTIEKFNKAMSVCRDLATFLSICGENEFIEKLTVIQKLHTEWQSTQETSDLHDICTITNPTPIGASDELKKFINNTTETVTTSNELPDLNAEQGKISESLTNAIDDANADISLSSSNLEDKKDDIDIFEVMKNVNIDKIKSRRGRPKGSKKPFWNFSSGQSKCGKKRKLIAEDDKQNKRIKTEVTNNETVEDTRSTECNDAMTNNETPWIQTSLISLSQNDKDEINGNKELNDKIIESAQIVLKEQFGIVNGFQSTLFKQNPKHFKKSDENMVQILHRGDFKSGHWFTISTIDCKEGTVNWYDSIYSELDNDSRQQICAIMKPAGKNITFQKCPVQNQVGGSDCGLFAIAFAVSLCLGMNPSKFIYDQEKMRRHLVECLEKQNFVNFPFTVNTNWKKKRIVKTKENIYCICRGLYDSAMVQCVVCESWIHHRCLDECTLRKLVNDQNLVFKCSNC